MTTVVDEVAGSPTVVTPPVIVCPFEQKSVLTAEQQQQHQSHTQQLELDPEESEDAEAFLKQLLERQQREREDLENRHRRELECLRQRLRSVVPSPSPFCEGVATANGGPHQRAIPHSLSAPHFPRAPHFDWQFPIAPPPPDLQRTATSLHRSNSEGLPPDPLGTGAAPRLLGRTRTLTDDLLRLVQLNGTARTCPASPEPKPTLHQLMQQRNQQGALLKEGAPPSPTASPLAPPSGVFPQQLHHFGPGGNGGRGLHRHQ